MHRPVPSLNLPVGKLRLTRPAADRLVPPDAPLLRVVETMLRHPEHRLLYVVAGGRLLGTIHLADVQVAVNARYGTAGSSLLGLSRQLRDVQRETASDLMQPPPGIRMDTPIRDALRAMHALQLDALPVVDVDERLVGELRAVQYLELALDVAMSTRVREPGAA